MKNKKNNIRIAIVCHRSTGIAILSRVVELFNQININAEYTFIISQNISNKELDNFIRIKKGIKIIRVFSILEKFILLKNFFFKKKKKNSQFSNAQIIPKKIKIKILFNLKSIFSIFLKLILRILDIYLLKLQFRNQKFDYAIFSNDRTNSVVSYLVNIFNRKKIVTIVSEIAQLSEDYIIATRKSNPAYYIDANGLIGNILIDQKVNKEREFHLFTFTPEETLAMFLTGVLPRDTNNIIGSIGFKKVLVSSNSLYKKCKNSPFLKNSNVINCLSVNEELSLNYRKDWKKIRTNICSKYNLNFEESISIFSVTCLTHSSHYTEEESEDIQLDLFKKVLYVNPKCLLMFHPSINSKRFSKFRKLFSEKIIHQSLPYITNSIDMFISIAESSAEEFLLPAGVECIILYKEISLLYKEFTNYKNLNKYKLEDKNGYLKIQNLVENKFVNKDNKCINFDDIRLFSDAFFD